MKPPCVALLTDFGLDDPYVGQMRGVLLSRGCRAPVVDLCHGVPPQDVRAASFILERALPYFPNGTLFVCVVDPGVGTSRRILWAKGRGRTFLAPDNGLLSRVELDECRSVEATKLFLPAVSSTFHGRDVFAPVAAALSRGASPARLGPRVRPQTEARAGGCGEGEVVLVDRFGNAVTDVAPAGGASVRLKGRTFGPARRTYGDAAQGEPLALIGSYGTVELAVRGGSFARRFGVKPGNRVRVAG